MITCDIESNNLLNEKVIDYTSSPYALKKDKFKMHCIVVEEHDTGSIIAFYDGPTYTLDGRTYTEVVGGNTFILQNYEAIVYEHRQLEEFPAYIANTPHVTVIGHNFVEFDILAIKLYYGLDYSIKENLWCGKPFSVEDTLIISKCLNPDRFGGHALEALGKKVGLHKISFRKNHSDAVRFEFFAADMLYYCIRDVQVNTKVYYMLQQEMANWNWTPALRLEHRVKDIVTRASHRGFKFDSKLAEKNLDELDALMAEREEKVSPLIPPKPATKKFMSEMTPPKQQFKDGGAALSSYIVKFVDRLGGTITKVGESGLAAKDYKLNLLGKEYSLPLAVEPLLKTQVAGIADTTHIKEWLVSLGWTPLEYKEKDLTYRQVKGVGKVKRTAEEYTKAVETYVEQTLNSNFCKDRCEFLKLNKAMLRQKLLEKDISKSVKVITNPSFTVGQDKDMCPNLEVVSQKFGYARDIVEYLTYKHRRNSILGGGLDWEEDEEPEKGYLASVREDGRIATPADSCGCATSRFKHKIVANIPRSTSLYGENMRGMFGVDQDYYQIGYDFNSLEAGIEGHYCWKWDTIGKEYCISLVQEKPNDVHSMMAKAISNIISKPFERAPAKSVKYGCLPLRTKVLTPQGWKLFDELQEGAEVISFNPETNICEKDLVLKKHYFEDKEVFRLSNNYDSFDSTGDHRWYGWKRTRAASSASGRDYGFTTTSNIVQENNILLSAPYIGGLSPVTVEQAALVGWVLSDGYYRWSELGEGTSCSYGKRKGLRFTIAQAIHKYWRELELCLKANNCPYVKREVRVKNGNTVFIYTIASEWAREFLDKVVSGRGNKHDVNWVEWVCSLSYAALTSFYEAFYHADGEMKNRHKVESISQNKGNIFDALVTTAQLLGRGRVTINSKGVGSPKCFSVRTQRRKHITCQELKKQNLGVEPTFCLTTNNSTFIIWQDDFIGITGNCTYGASDAKVAKIIGSDLKTGSLVFNAFWQAAFPLKTLKEKLKIYWETTGQKKFVLGIDGRKVPTRAAHALLNSLFQSAGVICAKYAMVEYEDLLVENKLAVDFFTQDWKNTKFVQQLIAYHDECQLETNKEFVTFKVFPYTEGDEDSFKASEIQAKEAKKELEGVTGKVWSDVSHTDKAHYIAYCLGGELVSKAVSRTSEHFKLNIPLTAGYIIGRSWAECH